MVALTARFPDACHKRRRLEERALSERLGVRHIEVDSREMEDPRYVAEIPPIAALLQERSCTGSCAEVAAARGPGPRCSTASTPRRSQGSAWPPRASRRAEEPRGPLTTGGGAGLTKAEVRAWVSEAYALPRPGDKPQMACLASRLPYGTAVTAERLSRRWSAPAKLGCESPRPLQLPRSLPRRHRAHRGRRRRAGAGVRAPRRPGRRGRAPPASRWRCSISSPSAPAA